MGIARDELSYLSVFTVILFIGMKGAYLEMSNKFMLSKPTNQN